MEPGHPYAPRSAVRCFRWDGTFTGAAFLFRLPLSAKVVRTV
jgi:hypothetical protein